MAARTICFLSIRILLVDERPTLGSEPSARIGATPRRGRGRWRADPRSTPTDRGVAPQRPEPAGDNFGVVRAILRVSGLLGVLLLLVGCGGSSDKAGGKPAPRTRVLRLAFGPGDESEVIGFADEVSRRTSWRLRIEIVTHWRYGTVDSEE